MIRIKIKTLKSDKVNSQKNKDQQAIKKPDVRSKAYF